MEVKAPSKAHGFQEQFMHKNRLQEYAQKSAIALPVYQTVNEGQPHAPQFRSSVVVDGKTFTSHRTFLQRKAAEQDVAKFALEILSSEIDNEGISLIQQDPIFCKSILHEYAVKTNTEKPTYTTSQREGILPVHVSSTIFNGQTYEGGPGKTKKEAEQLAALAVIKSILATSSKRRIMSEIIKSKEKLYSAFCNEGSSSGLLSERHLPLISGTQNNPNDTVNGKGLLANSINNQLSSQQCSGNEQIAKAVETETLAPEAKNDLNDTVNGKQLLANSTNNQLSEQTCSGNEQIAKAVETETLAPNVRKLKEEFTCEMRYGTNGNGNSQPTLSQSGSPALGTSSVSDSSDGVKQIGPSTRPEDSPGMVLASGMKRSEYSDTMKDEGNGSKKARILERPSTPPENPESLTKDT